MKKLFCLSVAVFAFAFQGSVSAQSLPDQSLSGDEVVNNFCATTENLGVQNESEIAEMVRSYIAELDQPTMEQIIALSQIAVELENGQNLDDICGN
ncbi:MAG: hypothetical protein QNJ53_04275 [Pleurocapsa sp. MO_192.B19]|nr:hypothetical protein [Pleurocapsa sp. MO_192.B19]